MYAEAIRTWTQPSKPKRNITNITNTKIVKIHKVTFGQPHERSAIFHKVATQQPKPNLNNRNKRNVKRHQNSDTKTGNREPQQNYVWGHGGLVVNTSDSGSRGRGSSPTRVAVLCP